ncbi:hypothetical protein DENSPDRAFT_805038 [Dentipellis sp. KUC8613]|nr:hypothetical protein DENSPDRAFT_805038 [Dentipellis sp. KUC8613]
MASSLFRIWIPLILFPALSTLAFRLLIGNLVKSGGGALIKQQCPPHSGPFSLSYTGVDSVDEMLCTLVTFFHAAMQPENLPLDIDFALSMAALVALPSIEAARQGRSLLLALPVAVGVYQLFGAGTIMPAYWLLFILSGQHQMSDGAKAKITRAHAMAILFSLFIGFYVLTGLMYAMYDPIVTAIWQAFPVWMSILQSLHLLVIRPSKHADSGYNVVRFTLILTFIISAIGHVGVVQYLWGDVAAFKHYYIPQVYPSSPDVTTMQSATLGFLQWDAAFFFGSTLLATLWFAQSPGQVIALLLWNVAASVALGPGAAVSGAFLWREAKLNSLKSSVKDAKKKQ